MEMMRGKKVGSGKSRTKLLTFGELLKNPIYKDRNVLYDMQPPTGFVHREAEKNELVVELAPILMGSKVHCVFVYGQPGTGKTGVMLELMKDLEKEAKKQQVALNTFYINCSENRTETTILMDVIAQLSPKARIPKSGWTRKKAVSEFYKALEDKKGGVVLVLDEVDYALKESGDDILYRMSRVKDNSSASVSTVIISNDVKVANYLKPRTRSTFGRVKVIFSPYDADALYDILAARAEYAIKPKVVGEAVLRKIAELEAERGGDARRVLELLDACAKLALGKKRKAITLDLVDEAMRNLDSDSTTKILTRLPKHQKILYLALLKIRKATINSEEVYAKYSKECAGYNVDSLTERRVRSFLVLFDELDLITSEVGWLKDIRKKTRKIKLNIDKALRSKIRKQIRDSI